jgi:hypothetical protein
MMPSRCQGASLNRAFQRNSKAIERPLGGIDHLFPSGQVQICDSLSARISMIAPAERVGVGIWRVPTRPSRARRGVGGEGGDEDGLQTR